MIVEVDLKDLVGTRVISGWGEFFDGWHAPASDWIVNDVRIGNRSLLSQAEDLPGDMFATGAIDSFVQMNSDPIPPNESLGIDVTYQGRSVDGVMFAGAVLGTSAIGSGRRERMILPLASVVLIPPGQTARITARPQDVAFRPERIFISGRDAPQHLLLRIDGVLHDFIKGGSVVRPTDEALDRLIEQEEDEIDPVVIELRIFGDGPMLWGTDERSGHVVLEIGTIVRWEDVQEFDDDDDEDHYDDEGDGEDGCVGSSVERREHFCRFDLNGFMPSWLPVAASEVGSPDLDNPR